MCFDETAIEVLSKQKGNESNNIVKAVCFINDLMSDLLDGLTDKKTMS